MTKIEAARQQLDAIKAEPMTEESAARYREAVKALDDATRVRQRGTIPETPTPAATLSDRAPAENETWCDGCETIYPEGSTALTFCGLCADDWSLRCHACAKNHEQVHAPSVDVLPSGPSPSTPKAGPPAPGQAIKYEYPDATAPDPREELIDELTAALGSLSFSFKAHFANYDIHPNYRAARAALRHAHAHQEARRHA